MKYFQINPCLYEHYCYGPPVKQDILMQSHIHHTCTGILKKWDMIFETLANNNAYDSGNLERLLKASVNTWLETKIVTDKSWDFQPFLSHYLVWLSDSTCFDFLKI